MLKKQNIYKCSLCGALIEALNAPDDAVITLLCCDKPMQKLTANTTDASKEKHVPVLEKAAAGTLVKIGSAEHPMEEKHYIEWIAVSTADGKVGRKFLQPGDKPEALFDIDPAKIAEVSTYCNLHNLWSSGVK